MAKQKPAAQQEKSKAAKKQPAKKLTKTVTTKTPQSAEPKPKAPTREEIATRAYHLYLQRGQTPGDPVEDWLRAERELRAERKG